LIQDRRMLFALEPHASAGASNWTDAYLGAFAHGHAYELAIFDRGFARWRELQSNILANPNPTS
jgi:predicted nucleic acid-binding protein